MSHYYTDNSALLSDRREFVYYFGNEEFRFMTDNGVFSKSGVDYGSYLLMKNTYREALGKSVLDLGCGYGPIGIIIKRFHPDLRMEMIDVNPRAVELARLNAEKNRETVTVSLCDDILKLDHSFDTIILNPPIRAGKITIFSLYEKSFQLLNGGGCLYIVIQKTQGAESSYRKLKDLFDETELIDRDGGYHIYRARKLSTQ